MHRRFALVAVWVAVWLGSHPIHAGDQAGAVLDKSPNMQEGMPMPSPTGTAEAGVDLIRSGNAEPSPAPFGLSMQPREYSFEEWLRNPDADPLISGRPPETALAVAIGLHDVRLLRRLLDQGFDPNAALFQPVAPWLAQLFDNNFAARVLAKDSRVTPLMLAVITEQTAAVRLLLRHGANPQVCTRAGHMYPLDFAAELGDVPIMQLLLGQEPSGDGEGRRVVISLSAQKAWLLQDGHPVFESPVSTGRAGYRTPTGEYVITQKYVSWKSTLYKVPMPNFMRLNCGQRGLHGGVVPGVPASHGCIRFPREKAATLYSIMRPGDRVSVVE